MSSVTLEKRTLTVAEAAQVLGLHKNAVYEAVKNGQIPAIKFGPRRIRIPSDAVERLLQQG